MIIINGSEGEGGGQILRSSLALSLVTGKPFRIVDIRGRRRRPGLRHQHLAAVRAAQAVSSADVEGAALGSMALSFRPGPVRSGDYAFAVATAGSTTLIAQTLIPALMLAGGASRVTLQGGTHNPMSPPYEFLARAYLPLLRRMGAGIHATLSRRGFAPAGGGRFDLHVEPVGALAPIHLTTRGPLIRAECESIVARLPMHIARRELRVVRDAFGWPEEDLQAREDSESPGPGNVLIVTLTFGAATEVFTGFGEPGVPAETVAERTVREVESYLSLDVAVGPHLADQLLVPLAVAGGGSFTTAAPTLHTRTNLQVIRQFVPVPITTRETAPGAWLIEVGAGRERRP